MPRLTITKKGYTRKAYTRKDGTRVKSSRVKPSRFTIKDRGARGRGRKLFPKLKQGTLGVSFKNKASTRRRQLTAKAKRIGEKRVVGKLRALQILNKRTNPAVSRKARADAKYIAGSFKGKRRVRYPTGLTKKR